MTPEERERMEYLCKRIRVEKNPLKLEKLVCELNDLVSATLESVQPKPKRQKDSGTQSYAQHEIHLAKLRKIEECEKK